MSEIGTSEGFVLDLGSIWFGFATLESLIWLELSRRIQELNGESVRSPDLEPKPLTFN